jgi:predicted acylesterase/phospholipase RssA
MEHTSGAPFVFRNYEVEGAQFDGVSGACMWEAAIASASAPVYFSPFVFRTPFSTCHSPSHGELQTWYSVTCAGSEKLLVDGGLGSNNPSLVALAEARALWPDAEIGCVVSLGCGDLSGIPSETPVTPSQGTHWPAWFVRPTNGS